MRTNFIDNFIEKEIATGKCQKVQTRFAPAPNGSLHIGHAKCLFLNFELAKKYNGGFNLRYDDTNPYDIYLSSIHSIENDLMWLGCKPDNIRFTSSYFDFILKCAFTLINKGLAYVCYLDQDTMREYRGTLKRPGVACLQRSVSVQEN